jgi:hypothetical protein
MMPPELWTGFAGSRGKNVVVAEEDPELVVSGFGEFCLATRSDGTPTIGSEMFLSLS